MSQDFFVVSGDTHIIEPVDLFKTRLPKNLRDRALWEDPLDVCCTPFVGPVL